ncbi:unnamed protein product [Linum tenue]|uniref:RNase H type-1 domain-containing protein n=1 Tax=Linum tenue TaxID=586396 RepID=A0AAV0J4B6_9ROSI|nr:unnamed protein product [Linum tenue]
MLRAFARNLGEGTITRAEITRLVHGLQAAWEMAIRKLIVQTDSRTAIQLITMAGFRHPRSAMILEAQRLLAQDWEVELHHVFREGNVVARPGNRVGSGNFGLRTSVTGRVIFGWLISGQILAQPIRFRVGLQVISGYERSQKQYQTCFIFS